MTNAAQLGRELAEQIADYLEGLTPPAGICHIHRDYCGHGLFFEDGVYTLCTVYDGFPSDPPNPDHPLTWDTREAFVAFMARQSDHSLSGADRSAPGLATHDPWLLNNQRLSRAMILNTMQRTRLHTILNAPPGAETWSDLMELLDAWHDEESLNEAVSYAEEQLAAWPDALRLAPYALIKRLLADPPDPRARLARVLILEHRPRLNSRKLNALLNTIGQGGLDELHMNHIELTPKLARTLLSSNALAGLTHLKITRAELTDSAMEALAEADWAESLTHLELDENHITGEGLKALCGSPHLTGVTTLGLMGNPLSGAGVAALMGSPLMGSLTHVRLDGVDTEAVKAMARCEQLDRLQVLDFPYTGAIDDEAMIALLRAPQLPPSVQRALMAASYLDPTASPMAVGTWEVSSSPDATGGCVEIEGSDWSDAATRYALAALGVPEAGKAAVVWLRDTAEKSRPPLHVRVEAVETTLFERGISTPMVHYVAALLE